jgi:hypothetical protein
VSRRCWPCVSALVRAAVHCLTPRPLQYPELDRLEQFRTRTARKKAAIETRLKTAVNSQLDDVKHGIQLLQMYTRACVYSCVV